MQSSWSLLYGQMMGQGPTLLVYLIGIVLCAVWWRRAPRAAVMAIIGCAVLLSTSIAVSFGTVYYITNRGSSPAATIGAMMTTIAIVGSVFRAAGFFLLLCAVFAERPRVVANTGFDVQYPPPLRS